MTPIFTPVLFLCSVQAILLVPQYVSTLHVLGFMTKITPNSIKNRNVWKREATLPTLDPAQRLHQQPLGQWHDFVEVWEKSICSISKISLRVCFIQVGNMFEKFYIHLFGHGSLCHPQWRNADCKLLCWFVHACFSRIPEHHPLSYLKEVKMLATSVIKCKLSMGRL